MGRFFLFLAIIFPVWAQAQPVLEGGSLVAFDHYPAEVYRQQPTNWSITQGGDGHVYAGNNEGVVRYDGERWELIPTTTRSVVRSLTRGPDGRIYVGARSDFGVLKADSSGTLAYQSLLAHVPDRYREFEDVWQVVSTSDGVYFQTRHLLFRWQDNGVDIWRSEEGFHTSFSVRDRFYVRDLERGLMTVKAEELQVAAGGSRFEDTPVYMMAPLGEADMLVATIKQGLLRYDGERFTPFESNAVPYLRRYRLYHGTALSGGQFAFATLGGGVVLIDSAGEVEAIYDKETGLPDNVINYLFEDDQRGLWIAFNNSGLGRVEPWSAITRFGDERNLVGRVRDIARFEDELYVATGAALMRMTTSSRGAYVWPSFEPVEGISLPSSLMEYQGTLLVSSPEGIHRLRDGRVEQVLDREVKSFTQTRSGRLFGAVKGELVEILPALPKWQVRPILELDGEVRSVFSSGSRELWLGTDGDGIYRVRLAGEALSFRHFGLKDGLPEGILAPTRIEDELLVLGADEAYRYEPRRTPAFTPDTASNRGEHLQRIYDGSDGEKWVVYERFIERVHEEGETQVRERPPSLQNLEQGPVSAIFEDVDGTMWFGNQRSLLRYDPARAVPERIFRPVQLRRVIDLARDRTLFDGDGGGSEGSVEVPAGVETLRVEVTAASFASHEDVQYRYRTRGTRGWSEWTERAAFVLRDLTPGDHWLEVEARTGTHPHAASMLSVNVLPHWYQTPWAAALFVVLALLFSGAGWQYRQMVLRNRAAREQARQLESERLARERLEQANDELRRAHQMRDDFLAVTSHELRTPLTAMMGYVDILQEEAADKLEPVHNEFLDTIEFNAQRLMDMILTLLETARIRSGQVALARERVDVREAVSGAVEAFREQVRGEGVALCWQRPEEPYYALADAEGVRQAVEKLIDNGIKFTKEGYVRLSVEQTGSEIAVTVEDTGIGIEEEFLPELFDEFTQASRGAARSYSGAGLGLAVAARLVELMGGRIHVSSEVGKGSVFRILLPAEPSIPSPSVEDHAAV